MPPKQYGLRKSNPIRTEHVPVTELFCSDSDSCPTERDSQRIDWSDSSDEFNESSSNSSLSDVSTVSDSEGDSGTESKKFHQGIQRSRTILRDSRGDPRKWRPPSPSRRRLRRQNAFVIKDTPLSFGQTCPLGSPPGRKTWQLPNNKEFIEGSGVCNKKRKVPDQGSGTPEVQQQQPIQQRIEEKGNGGSSGIIGERSYPIASNGSIHDFLLCSEEEDNRVCPRCSIAEAFYKKVRQGCTHQDNGDDYEYIDIWFDLLAERERSRIKQEDKTTKTETTLVTRTPTDREEQDDQHPLKIPKNL
nr:hypothetical protein [Cressdnaviricota sp.]